MSSAGPRWATREFGAQDAPPVVLLHSIATQGGMWLPQVGPWARHFRLLLIDLPGHGATPPDESIASLEDYSDRLMQLLSDLKLGSVAIVGLSLGGMIAQACALRHPQRLWSVVIANSLAQVGPAANAVWDKRIRQAEADGIGSQTADTLSRWFTAGFRAENPMTLDWVRNMIESTSLDGYRTAIGAIKKLDYLDRLSEIKCPALVVTGAEDSVATSAVLQAMAGRIAGSQTATIEKAAHLSNIEQPLRFTELVGAFLKAHAAP